MSRPGKNQRVRGRLLTEYGLVKVQATLQAWPTGHLSQRELSRLCGLNSATVNRLLRRQMPVDTRSLEQLFSFLGLTLEPADWQFPQDELNGALTSPVTVRQRQLMDAIAWLTGPRPRMVTLRGVPGSGRSWFLHQLGLGAQRHGWQVERFGSFDVWRRQQPWYEPSEPGRLRLWLLDCPDLVRAEREWRALLLQDLLGHAQRERLAIAWVRPWQWLEEEPITGWENLDLLMGPLELPDLDQLVRAQDRRQPPQDWPRRVAEQSRGYARLAVLLARQWFRWQGGNDWTPAIAPDSLGRWREEVQQLPETARHWLFYLTLVGGDFPIRPDVLTATRGLQPDPSRLSELLRNGWLRLGFVGGSPASGAAVPSDAPEAVTLFPGLERVLLPLLQELLVEELRADQPYWWGRLDFRQHPHLGDWLQALAHHDWQMASGLADLNLHRWSPTARRNLLLLLQTLEEPVPSSWALSDWFPSETLQFPRPSGLSVQGDVAALPSQTGALTGMIALESGLLTAHARGWVCYWSSDLQHCFGWSVGRSRLQRLAAVVGDRFVTVTPEGTWQLWTLGQLQPTFQGEGLPRVTAIAATEDWLVLGNGQGQILALDWRGQREPQSWCIGEAVEALAVESVSGRGLGFLVAGLTQLLRFRVGCRTPLTQRRGKDWMAFRQLAVHPSGQLVMATRASGEVVGFSLPDLECCASPAPLPVQPLICDWLCSGTSPPELVSCLMDGTVLGWRSSGWQQLRFGFRTRLRRVALSRRGRIFTLSETGRLCHLSLQRSAAWLPVQCETPA